MDYAQGVVQGQGGNPQAVQPQMQQAQPQAGGFIQELDQRLMQMGQEKVMMLDQKLSQADPQLLMLVAEALPEIAEKIKVLIQMGNDGQQGMPAQGQPPASGLAGI